MRVRAFNIRYDTDGHRIAGLPRRLVFDIDRSDFDPAEDLAGLISDYTGWCIFGCDFKVLEPKKESVKCNPRHG